MRKIIFFITMAIFIVSGCAPDPVLERTQIRNKVAINGEFLTENPDVINFPIRIVIAIDDSGSMAGSDPTGSRFDAAMEFVESYHENESVKFDIIHWNNVTRKTTGGFTRDLDQLRDVMYDYNNTGTTNYEGAITTAQTHFLSEISEMKGDVAQSANVARMKCIVLFFSDGLPNPRNDSNINDAIISLKERLIEEEGVALFNFHTFFLSTLLLGNPVDYSDAINLMTTMANNGSGRFVEFEDASSIEFINIVDMRLTVEYKMKFILAYNMNVIPDHEIVLLDSDGDGLPDDQEDTNLNGIVDVDQYGNSLETDPMKKDTDGDGLSDYFETKLSTIDDALNPLDSSDSGCPSGTETFDSDRDGLTDCEEYIKGTRYNNPDTDLDGIPDGIEFYAGTNPLENQAMNDTDFDGNVDWMEVQRHTNVSINDEKIRERYSYYYDIEDKGLVVLNQGTEHESRRRNISFEISNIDILDSLPTETRLEGDNLIRLFIAEVPEDMPESNPVYRVAEIIVNYNSHDGKTIVVDSFESL